MQAVFSADLFARAYYAAGAEPHRWYLHGVYVEPREGADGSKGVTMTATNGLTLLSFYDPHGYADAPQLVRADPATLKACRASKGVGSRIIAIDGARLEVIESAPDNADERLKALQGEGARSHIQASSCLGDGHYPDWRRAVPKGELIEGARAAIDAKLLASLAYALSTDRAQFLRLYAERDVTGDRVPHVVRGNHPHGFGLVMSGRLNVRAPVVPTWV